MAFVVLFSTMSFTIDMHFCGDTLVDTALFREAKNCGMEMQKPSSSECSITKKNCCSDKQIIVDGQDELKRSFEKLTPEQQQFVASFIYSYLDLFEGFDKHVTSYETYKPPLVVKDIQKLDEVYLI